MGRAKKDSERTRELCTRLLELIDVHLKLPDSEIAARLGYQSGGTIHRVRNRRDTFPDTERLERLAQIETDDGARPNIDWVITGQGAPLIYKTVPSASDAPPWLIRLAPYLDKKKADALGEFLSTIARERGEKS